MVFSFWNDKAGATDKEKFHTKRSMTIITTLEWKVCWVFAFYDLKVNISLEATSVFNLKLKLGHGQ